MSRRLPRAAAAALLAALALTASDEVRAQEIVAYEKVVPPIDLDAFFGAVPRMKALADETLAQARELNEAMERLAASEGDAAKNREARAATRDLLVRYRERKLELVKIVDTCLKTAPAKEADLDILKKLREKDLQGIAWKERKFVDCLRDIAGPLDLRFVLHPDVLMFNTVEARFETSPADGILRFLTAGFDCDYYVHNGEIIVIKSIKRNDKRMQKFLDRHPDWKFWRKKEAVAVEDDL